MKEMMANPRRNSYSISCGNNESSSSSSENNQQRPFEAQTLTAVKLFLKKPHAFPFLLSLFLLLTWLFLRFQQLSPHFSTSSPPHLEREDIDGDQKANLVRFASAYPSRITKDKRGWLLNPLSVAFHAGISGGALTCVSIHVGEIQPGGVRGNHRHYTCNETFLIWGAKTIFRLENNAVHKGYAEVTVGADEVAVAASPSGTAHALVNVDPVRSTFFIGCQDSIINYNSSTSDFNIWKDL
ncbi:uncharacterized protein LOC132289821 isoform X2 [Cornus florida]|uniref:uncharacterized protein LOC132289821 isoform X2 n=1 Tax=Cornus florida TaxID=4283 RepID=UPI0028A2CEBC|nr:uncharacterized protein LOC132289821 isoform X2 [Cornus florida]